MISFSPLRMAGLAALLLTAWLVLPPESQGAPLLTTIITNARISNGSGTVSSSTAGLYPANLREIDGTLYFGGNLSTSGIVRREPCVSHGTLDTTYILKDIYPGTTGSEPTEFTKAGSFVFFAAADNLNGRELWKTDGTEAGTVLVKNINPGSASADPTHLIACNGKLLFSATDGEHGEELWVSDGTENGTQMLLDIYPGKPDSAIDQVFLWNGIVYFSARNGTNNTELWRTDGTTAGTYQLKDIGSSSSDPASLVIFNGALYFQANSPAAGLAQLWKTDGTEAGTVLVKNIPNSTSGIGSPTIVGDRLFFTAPEINHDLELWCSDGTGPGTYLVRNINAETGSSPHDLVAYHGELYFVANDGVRGDQIWKSDGTEAGTVLVHEIYNGSGKPAPRPNSLVVFQDRILFKQTRDDTGSEWWQTDGTAAGLALVADINPGVKSGVSSDVEYVLSGTTLYFSAYEPTTYQELYKFTTSVGALQVTLTPEGALAAGAMWQVDGGASHPSGAVVSGLSGGSHLLTFSGVSGYNTPGSQSVNIVAGQTTSASGAYTPAGADTGSLQVTITPAAAVSAGAQWRVDGGAWQGSGATINGLAQGAHTVSFKAVAGYLTPGSQNVEVATGQKASTSGNYTPAGAATGSLRLLLLPADVLRAGVGWQVDGGPLQESNATVSGLAAGSHLIHCTAAEPFITPPDTTVEIVADQETVLVASYYLPEGTVLAPGTYLGVPDDRGGRLVVSVNVHGGFSAQAIIGGQHRAFAGRLEADGSYSGVSRDATHTPLTLHAGTDLGRNQIGAFYLQGRLNQVPVILNHAAPPSEFRSLVGRTTPTLATHTPGETPATAVELVRRNGVVTLASRLPNGRRFSVSSVVTGGVFGNQSAFYAPLAYPYATPRGAAGWLCGTLVYPTSGPGAATGLLRLVKPPQSRGPAPLPEDAALYVED